MSAELNAIAEFVWLEADLLDQKDYAGWLNLWDENGIYVIPIDRQGGDFKTRLNYAYDDAAMRSLRVRRLTSGESVSARAAGVTIRTVSRFRQLESSAEGTVRVRCAQHLSEFRNGRDRAYVADVTFSLRPEGESFRILEKAVLLGNSTDALAGMTFLL